MGSILLLCIGVYLFVIYVGIRLVVPYYGYTKAPIPTTIPQEWQDIITTINNESTTNKEFLKRAYDYLIIRYHGGRFKTILEFPYAFMNIFSHRDGYIPCSVHNQLLRIMLVKSGRFRDEDIKTQVVFFNFFTHQYLKVYVEGAWISVDPNSAYMGITFGNHAVGIH